MREMLARLLGQKPKTPARPHLFLRLPSSAAGTSHANLDGLWRQVIIKNEICADMPILLRMNPDNPRGIDLFTPTGQQFGSLKQSRADQARSFMRTHCTVDAVVIAVTGGEAETPMLGVDLEVRVWTPF